MGDGRQITKMLHDWNEGDDGAREALLPFVYDELRRQAQIAMRSERDGHTLQPTALVHEVYLKICKQTGVKWIDRTQFFAFAARMMREILIDHARRYAAKKRGSKSIRFSIDDVMIPVDERAESLVALDEALCRLKAIDERQAEVVEMRFFAGMTIAEIAEALGVSERTVSREWDSARLWLFRELNG